MAQVAYEVTPGTTVPPGAAANVTLPDGMRSLSVTSVRGIGLNDAWNLGLQVLLAAGSSSMAPPLAAGGAPPVATHTIR